MMVKKHLLFVSFVLMFFVGQAHAALNAEAVTAVGLVSDNALEAETLVWPVIAIVLTALISIKLVKRFTAKI